MVQSRRSRGSISSAAGTVMQAQRARKGPARELSDQQLLAAAKRDLQKFLAGKRAHIVGGSAKVRSMK
jgi:hypothetical protein